MNATQQLAKHIRDLHFGGNWTVSCLKDLTADLSWKQSVQKVSNFNTIVGLVYHINYFVKAVIPVLEGKALDAHDKYSYDHPPIHSQEDWESFLQEVWKDAERFAQLVENLEEKILWDDFTKKKYGNYYRNLLGIIEHSHYHMGQIAMIRKMVQ
jgi:uncharacterized damage-inducible protein DinB